MHTSEYWIKKLRLQKHPEGGWFKETYRSLGILSEKTGFGKHLEGERNISTSIYYLLEAGDYSAFHRIKSDELWHYYTGNSAIEILWIDNGVLHKELVGANYEAGEHFQQVIPKNNWFAARLTNQSGFALVGCTVAPGFHFNDFELATNDLLLEFPDLAEDVKNLIKKNE